MSKVMPEDMNEQIERFKVIFEEEPDVNILAMDSNKIEYINQMGLAGVSLARCIFQVNYEQGDYADVRKSK